MAIHQSPQATALRRSGRHAMRRTRKADPSTQRLEPSRTLGTMRTHSTCDHADVGNQRAACRHRYPRSTPRMSRHVGVHELADQVGGLSVSNQKRPRTLRPRRCGRRRHALRRGWLQSKAHRSLRGVQRPCQCCAARLSAPSYLVIRLIISTSSSTFRRCPSGSPSEKASATQCAT